MFFMFRSNRFNCSEFRWWVTIEDPGALLRLRDRSGALRARSIAPVLSASGGNPASWRGYCFHHCERAPPVMSSFFAWAEGLLRSAGRRGRPD